MKSKNLVVIEIVAMIPMLLLLGCRDAGDVDTDPELSRIDDIVVRGLLRVGISVSVPGVMRDNSGKWIGFDIDVASRLADDLGVDVVFVESSRSKIIPSLVDGDIDVIISGMEIRPDRHLSVNFSVPYDYAGISLVANRVRARDYSSLEDFNDPRVVVAGIKRTGSVEAIERHLPNAEPRLYDDESDATDELLDGTIDALIAEAPIPAFVALDNPETLYQPLPGTISRRPVGIALPRGDIDLLNFFDGWIRLVEAEGWFAERKHYWFETKDWASRL